MSDVTFNVRQISSYPQIMPNGSEAVLLQQGGIGGPYAWATAAHLVQTSLAGGSLAIGSSLPASTTWGQVFTNQLIVAPSGHLYWNAYIDSAGTERYWQGGFPAGLIWMSAQTGNYDFMYAPPSSANNPVTWQVISYLTPTGFLGLNDQVSVGRDASNPLELTTLRQVQTMVTAGGGGSGSSGTIGIGVTVPSNAENAQIFSNQFVMGTSGHLYWNAFLDTTGVERYWSAGPAGLIWMSAQTGAWNFMVAPTGTANQGPISWVDVMSLTPAGQVALTGQITVGRDAGTAMELVTFQQLQAAVIAGGGGGLPTIGGTLTGSLTIQPGDLTVGSGFHVIGASGYLNCSNIEATNLSVDTSFSVGNTTPNVIQVTLSPRFVGINGNAQISGSGSQPTNLTISRTDATGASLILANTMASWNFQVAFNGTLSILQASTQRIAIDLSGNTYNTTGSWATFSDVRLKRNINRYESGLNEVMALEPIEYQYNGDGGMPDDPAYVRRVGLDAEKTWLAMPECVGQRDGYYTLDNGPLLYALINAIKELEARLRTLESA